MAEKDNTKDTQNKRIEIVFDYLKTKKQISQRDISDELSRINHKYDEQYLTKLKKGGIKKIPKDVIRVLHEKYGVNPKYLELESESMFSTLEIELKGLSDIVDEYKVIKGDNRDIICLKMNKSIYELIIELWNTKQIIEQNGISSYENEKNTLIDLFSSYQSKTEEYVLIPRSDFEKTILDDLERDERLRDVVFPIDYRDFEANYQKTEYKPFDF